MSRRGEQIMFFVSPQEKAEITRIAREVYDMSVSDYARKKLLGKLITMPEASMPEEAKHG